MHVECMYVSIYLSRSLSIYIYTSIYNLSKHVTVSVSFNYVDLQLETYAVTEIASGGSAWGDVSVGMSSVDTNCLRGHV